MYRWWCAASCLPTCSNASILAQRIRRDQTETRSIMTRRSVQLVVGLTCACHLVISKAGNRWSLRAWNPAPSIAARERDRRDQSDLIETSADTHALLVCWRKVKGEKKIRVFVLVREGEEEEELWFSSVPTVSPTPTVVSFISSSLSDY